VLKFHPSVAPIKVAVFPLVKNKPELVAKARAIFETLQVRRAASRVRLCVCVCVCVFFFLVDAYAV
jgi:glycyl-tRNA synthetase (class II)